MPRDKKFFSAYFSFTRKERTGILVILGAILFFTLLPFFFSYFIPKKQTDHSAFEKAITTLQVKQRDSSYDLSKQNNGYENDQHYYPNKNYYNKAPTREFFNFDPNTLDVAGWKKLGIREKTINTIQNYIAKGGKFRQPSDIAKIWGLHEDEVQRLMPYVVIAQQTDLAYEEKKNFDNKAYKKQDISIRSLDINTADTSAFIALPGIGSKLANRIIAFRDKLGGFYKVEQVGETFALPDSTFQKIKSHLLITRPTVKQFNINSATADEMKTHPYIRYNLAAAIVQYRTQHGPFAAITDIKKIMMVTDDIYNKLTPYLSVQ